MTGCGATIPPGEVGIVVDKFGQNRGVQDYTIKTGWVSYNPWTSSVIEYPVYMQTISWTKDPLEGEPGDESITFTTKGSTTINADISLSYELERESVPMFYVTFRHGNIRDFTYGYLHNIARDAMMEIGGRYTVEQVMGDNEQFLKDVKGSIQAQVKAYGITLHQFGFIGAPRPPQSVTTAINSAQQAQYLAQQKRNEILQSEADAEKKVAQAKGEADAAVTRAEGDAKANALLNASLSDKVLEKIRLDVQWHWIDAWEKGGARVPDTIAGGNSSFLLQPPKQEAKQ